MAAPVLHSINNNTFWLLPQKAIFWEEQKTIIVSDLHLGKTGHFRKEGIAVPQAIYKDDLHRLFHLIQLYKPEKLVIAGDMFHSRMNKEVDLFTRWRNDVPHVEVCLVKGNHDILHTDHYVNAGITLFNQYLHLDGFCFVHDVADINASQGLQNTEPTAVPATSNLPPATSQQPYYFCGHLHPGIVVKTGSRQSLRLPCYYFAKDYAVLPAFSAFSGMFSISPKKNEHVFAIVNNEVMKMGK